MGFTLVALFVMALPFVGARGVARLPLPWPFRLFLAAAVPALLLTWIATTPWDVTDLGAAIAIFFVVTGWLLGAAWPGIVGLIRLAATDTAGDVLARRDRDRLQRLR